MNAIRLVSIVIVCSALTSLLTWYFVKESYDAGYELIGSISNAGIVKLNTRALQLDDKNEAWCHLAKYTQWIVDDLRSVEVPDKYIIGGPNLPSYTETEIAEALTEFDKTEIGELASTCQTSGKLF